MLVNINILIFALTYFYGQCFGSEYESAGYSFYPNSGWMRLNTEPEDWSTARTNCHSQNAFLLSPWSEELISVAYVIQSHGSFETIFSGVHTTYADGALIYMDGKPTISMNPVDLAPLEHCGVFFANGTMGQVQCDQQLPYICYAPATDLIPEPETVPTHILEPALSATPGSCGEQNLGYEFMEVTGNCYKFHIDLVDNLDDAQIVCEYEGAHVAEVDSGLEAQFLMQIYSEKLDYANDIRFSNFESHGEDWMRPEPEFTVRSDIVYAYHWFRRTSHFICEKPSTKPETEPKDFKPRPVVVNITKPSLEYGLTSLFDNLDKNKPVIDKEDAVFDHEPEIKTETPGNQKIGPGFSFKPRPNKAPENIKIPLLLEFDLTSPRGKENFDNIDEENAVFDLDLEIITSETPEKPKLNLVTDTKSPTRTQVEFESTETAAPPTRSCDTSRGYTRQIFDDIVFCIKRHLQNEDSMENAKSVCLSEEAKLLEKNGKVFDEIIDSWNDFYDEDTEPTISFEDSITTMNMKQRSLISQYDTANYAYFRTDGLVWFLCQKEPEKKTESTSVKDKPYTEVKQEIETGYKGDTNIEPTIEIETAETEIVTVTNSELQSELHIDVKPAPNCVTQGYEYAEMIGQCYKFHEVAQTWNDARLTCASEGAHLAIANSDKEAQFLANLFKKSDKIFNGEIREAAIGFFKPDVRSFDENWLTVTGDKLEQTGYTSWGPNEPKRYAQCGFINREGLLTTRFSEVENIPFICEKKPDYTRN